MISTARTIQQWEATTNLTGVTTASLHVVLVVSTAIGALVGLAIGGFVDPLPLAVVAGFLGTIAAGIARNTLLIGAWAAAGVEDAGTPIVVITYAAVASLAGSLAADRIALLIEAMPPIVIGGFAGLLSAVLLGLLMVTYRMNPARPGDPW